MHRILIPLEATPATPAPGSELLEIRGASMGTSWSAKILLPPALRQQWRQGHQGLQARLDRIEQQMSHWRADSDLSRFNRAPAGSWHILPPELAQVVDCGLRLRQLSGAAFDPCAGALVRLWGFGATNRHDQPGFRVPDQASIDAARQPLQSLQLQWDAGQRRLYQSGGIELDLSAIAKGFAVDELARWLHAQEIHHFLLELGGELRGAGVKADGQPWWVQLEAVPGCAPVDHTLIALHGLAVATSGDYRQHFRHQGRELPHTLDPRQGKPLHNDLAAVTVVHAQCMLADAWSTALGVLGPQAGLELAAQQQLAVRFLLRRGAGLEAIHSPLWQAMLQ